MSGNPKGRKGILPVNPALTKKSTAGNAQPKPPPKAPSPRLRLIVRRLPPGLTETEFWTCLGEEWGLSAGKVDWAAYKEGKVSKDPSKPSKPARAYLRVKEQSHLDLLSARVKQTTFQDAKNTTKDPCLLGPPSLEFAPFNKVPGARVRHDGRQGTIDQDQEFIDFLQSLTEPTTKPVANGTDGPESKPSATTTTPLIQYIKEKKAAKAREAALSKSTKGRQDAKNAKSAKAEPKVVVKNANPSATEKARMAKATQETVRAINKSVATMQTKGENPKDDTKSSPAVKDTPTAQQPAKRERERGNASAAARILQRDLGLTPRPVKSSRVSREPGSTGDEKVIKANLPATTLTAVSQPPASTPTAPPTGPRKSRASSLSSSKPPAQPQPPPQSQPQPAAPSQRASKPPPQPSANAKSAFLKHANASQGVTEDLLRAAFEAFGALTKCEIDRKKGFGYVDFTDAEGLKKAIAASPVKVGNGSVVVLENKLKPQAKSGPPAPVSAPPVAESTSTPAQPAEAEATADPASVQAPLIAPTAPKSNPTPAPTAPRGAAKTNASRGNPRGGFGPQSRGNFSRGGGSRAGFRGGRGNAGTHSRGGRGGTTSGATEGGSPSPVTATPASSSAAGDS